MKKTVSLVLVLFMVLALCNVAFAASSGTITVENAVKNETYKVYKVFDMSFSDDDDVAYSYKKTGESDPLYIALSSAESPFVLHETVVDGVYNVRLKSDDTTAAQISDFLSDLVDRGILSSSIAEKKATSDKVVFSGLDYGYYFVSSSVGSVVSLTNTKPNAKIEDKNSTPSSDKTVKEDSNGQYGEVNTADVGDTVEFKSVVSNVDRIKKLVFHDKMDASFTFVEDSVEITVNGVKVTDDKYSVKTEDLSDGCTFEVSFKKSFTDTVGADDVVVRYSAVLNDACESENRAWISYGDGSKSNAVITTTKTYGFEINKYTRKNRNDKLADAKFVIYKLDAGKEIFATFNDGVLSGWTTKSKNADVLVSNLTSNIIVSGLDADVYYIREIEAPVGYTLMSDLKVTIDEDGNVYTDGSDSSVPDSIIDIENKSGVLLPDTGGRGAKIFYIAGGILILASLVLLVTRKMLSKKTIKSTDEKK